MKNGNAVPDCKQAGPLCKRNYRLCRYAGKELYAAKMKAMRNTSSTDVKIAIKLKEENKAFKVEKYEHSYPHCWRTDKPMLYYPLDSWFIKTTAMKDRLVS